jgi:hypothetical protein
MPPVLGIARGASLLAALYLSTARRQSWTGTFMGWIFWIWLPWLGFAPMMVLTMQAISLLYQFWIHTELVSSLGPLELVFNTPSHHRVHHGSNPRTSTETTQGRSLSGTACLAHLSRRTGWMPRALA